MPGTRGVTFSRTVTASRAVSSCASTVEVRPLVMPSQLKKMMLAATNEGRCVYFPMGAGAGPETGVAPIITIRAFDGTTASGPCFLNTKR